MRQYIGGKERKVRSGFVLPAVVFSIAIMSIIVVVALSTADDERRASRATRESTLATYAAEAGVRKTLGSLPATSISTMAKGDSLDLGWQTMPNKAAYRAVIHRIDNGGTLQLALMVQGRRTGINGGQASIATQIANSGARFKNGIYSEGLLKMTGMNPLSDSYDSDIAAYNVATAGNNGSLASNNAIQLSATTVVKGDVTAAGTITGGLVSGVTYANAPPVTPNPALACPAGGFSPASAVPAGTGVSYNAATGALLVGGTNGLLTLNVPPTQYYFSSVTIAGTNSKITFNNPTAQHVDIFVSGVVDLSGGSVANPSGKTTLLSISACGSPAIAPSWTLSGGSGAYFAVYAPTANITLSGSGDIWGAIVGKTFSSSGGSRVHYDEALARAPGNQGLRAVSGAWAQFPGN